MPEAITARTEKLNRKDITASLAELQRIHRLLRPERIETHTDFEALLRGTVTHLQKLIRFAGSSWDGLSWRDVSTITEKLSAVDGSGNLRAATTARGLSLEFNPDNAFRQLTYRFDLNLITEGRASKPSIKGGKVFAIMPPGLEGPDNKRLNEILLLDSALPLDDSEVKFAGYFYRFALGDFLSLPQLQPR